MDQTMPQQVLFIKKKTKHFELDLYKYVTQLEMAVSLKKA